ncbi:hypothetical protein KIW84_042230 [Lathyrus oleraceus]|uniref:Uncharacterized protein n=1 Tax=Pisum sativum TaxID=3888 RepID=A0A9D4XCH2_PEA|nr:hypothetical protein KIW84_042230 [Pisum sativum]
MDVRPAIGCPYPECVCLVRKRCKSSDWRSGSRSTCAWQCDVPQAGRGSFDSALPLWGLPGPIQRLLWISVQRLCDDDGDVSFSSVYFGTPESDFWLISTSDGCDQSEAVTQCQFLTCLIDTGIMNLPNADLLELKEMIKELSNVVKGLAVGQRAIAERLERIENWLRMGEIQGDALSSGVTTRSGSSQHKKEIESRDVHAKGGKDRYHPYAATLTIPAGNQSVQQQHQPPPQRTQRAGYQVRRRTSDRHFDKPPVTYASLFKRLMDLGLVQPRTLVPGKPDQRLASYDENVRCKFHAGAPGHHIEDCKAFKHVVQDLVDSKAINFALMSDVNTNPMPMHGPMGVNVMFKDKRKMDETNGDQLKIPMSVVQKRLTKSGDFPGVDNCRAAVATKGRAMMRETIQGIIEVEMDDVRCKAPRLAVETVQVENVIIAGKEKKPSISSYKQAVEVVRNGGIPGWGRIIGIVVKADMFWIGYQEGQDSSERNRGRRPPFAFISAGMLDSVHADAVSEEIDSDRKLKSWIKSCVPGSWKA